MAEVSDGGISDLGTPFAGNISLANGTQAVGNIGLGNGSQASGNISLGNGSQTVGNIVLGKYQVEVAFADPAVAESVFLGHVQAEVAFADLTESNEGNEEDDVEVSGDEASTDAE